MFNLKESTLHGCENFKGPVLDAVIFMSVTVSNANICSSLDGMCVCEQRNTEVCLLSRSFNSSLLNA